ncbi:MAG: long-chain fatty acid--CoA ligase [Mucilaginibacter polytrichastri]|nr:long-chain fatty acid--CoA ligase [Mucilaginibacter polytrichastri]
MNPVQSHFTIPMLLRNAVKQIHADTETFLLEKTEGKWQEISFRTVLDHADAVSAYMMDLGIKKGDRLALIIENSPAYVYFDQGIQQIGAVNTSIYPTLSEADVEYILNDSGAKAILVGNPFLLRKVVKIANNCPELVRIIPAFADYQKYTKTNLYAGVLSFDEMLEEGRQSVAKYKREIEASREAILPSDVSALIYTSGTTGTPKGVMLTHNNLVENVRVCLDQLPVVDQYETFLSFLPLSHVFERTATYHVCMALGCRIAFAESLELLAKNMGEIRPTVMNCVPRLLERIHDRAYKNGTAGDGAKAKIFLWAMGIGKKYREKKEAKKTVGPVLALQHKLAEKLVFSKIKEKTGGRLKFMISGGGALPKNVGEFFGDLGIKILEGFGLTETSPVMSVTEFHRQVYGTVGRVLPGLEVGIQDVESKFIHTIQTYDSFREDFQSEEGEIIVRGHCVMKGYWNKPEETANVIDTEGWFHTGDIGRFYKGNLQITDRLKNMLVNAYGKNIYPTPVENTYLKSRRIEQVFLIGDKREYVTAIIVPSQEGLRETFGLAEEFFQRPELFIDEPGIVDWVAEDVRRLSNELAKFERIKTFKVKRQPFSMEAGEVTPTMKAKRKVIEKKYAGEIEELYME